MGMGEWLTGFLVDAGYKQLPRHFRERTSVAALLRSQTDHQAPPHVMAHYQEHHWVWREGSWAEGAEFVTRMFPRATRVDRPYEWYALLKETHWPGDLPPGNGPFFLPEWAWTREPADRVHEIEQTLKANKFVRVSANVCSLPANRDALVWAMRLVGNLPWTAMLPARHVVFYHTLEAKAARAPLREYLDAPNHRPRRASAARPALEVPGLAMDILGDPEATPVASIRRGREDS